MTRHDSLPRSRATDDNPKLEHGLCQAVLAGGPALRRQPIVRCPTGRLHGFGAPPHRHKPGAGPLFPATFVPTRRGEGAAGPLQ